MNNQDLIKKAMALLGSRKSKRKSLSSASNGKNGGRPRKLHVKA